MSIRYLAEIWPENALEHQKNNAFGAKRQDCVVLYPSPGARALWAFDNKSYHIRLYQGITSWHLSLCSGTYKIQLGAQVVSVCEVVFSILHHLITIISYSQYMIL